MKERTQSRNRPPGLVDTFFQNEPNLPATPKLATGLSAPNKRSSQGTGFAISNTAARLAISCTILASDPVVPANFEITKLRSISLSQTFLWCAGRSTSPDAYMKSALGAGERAFKLYNPAYLQILSPSPPITSMSPPTQTNSVLLRSNRNATSPLHLLCIHAAPIPRNAIPFFLTPGCVKNRVAELSQ